MHYSDRNTPIRLALTAAILLAAPAAAEQPDTDYHEFPPGFDWPANPEALQKAIDERDLAAVRRHGWYLWAGLNTTTETGQPIWSTWPTATQVFQAGSPPTPVGEQETSAPASAGEQKTSPPPPAGEDKTTSPLPLAGEDQITSPPQTAEEHQATSPPQIAEEHQATSPPPRAGEGQGGGKQESAPQPPTTPHRNSRHLRALRAGSGEGTYINQPGPDYIVQQAQNGQCVDSQQTSLPDGQQFQSNGDIMIAGVIYNQQAMDWNRNPEAPLYQAAYLTEQWGNRMRKEIGQFPSESIVLKHMYWPVQSDQPTALPVWDPDQYDPDPPSYIGYEYWKRVVAVDPQGGEGGEVEVSFLHHINKSKHGSDPLPTRTVQAKRVSIENFYHRRIEKDEWQAMDPADQALLTAAACWLYNRPFQPDDYLITVAMHINTKEIPQWALQSLWWHDQPDQGRFAENRPDIPKEKAPGPWRHYLMTTAYGIPTDTGDLPVSFNPYIELAAAHPINTNCRNCHLRAAWPPGNRHLGQKRSSSYLADPGPGPMADLKPDDPIFEGLMLMDFQWSTVDRAIPVPGGEGED